MAYQFKDIEKKWQKSWQENNQYKTIEDKSKPKYYVLDMFPYPSGAGLHVGHPLGYIASDIYSRYKTLKGFNVLHPMGYDAYGLPAEQYAIQTGQHPAVTTAQNIKRYKEQFDKIGFSYDWSREIQTCDPKYYKWTQWAFLEMFNHYYDLDSKKVNTIDSLKEKLSKNGLKGINAYHDYQECEDDLTSETWNKMNEVEQDKVLHHFRLAYLADMSVNWCSELGTVLANDEVKDGLSVRGGYPVTQRKMKQWCLRVSAYSQRLLDGLENLEWSESIKEVQRNWIGRSEGAEVTFKVNDSNQVLNVFTTRPDTIFGVTFMVLAPESDLVSEVTLSENKNEVDNYIKETKKKTERERIADVKNVSGVFTGSYCSNPFTGKNIPIWISDYVLAGYGTGAIMAVPAHDSRDYAFAKKFELPIVQVLEGGDISESAFEAKEGILMNSEFLNGMTGFAAIKKMNDEVESRGMGKKKINYRLRDAIFSRQRYWGEPFPIYYKNNIPKGIDLKDLPLELPEVDAYLPTESGEPPLGRASNWVTKDGDPIELNTMPGFAGSSAYFLRYMDPNNEKELVSKEANSYWENVDLYLGGTEHATGHLIYSRFWNMFLFDLGHVCKEEPFKKLFNQGMIQGRSNFVYRIKGTNKFVSFGLQDKYDIQTIHVDVNIVKNDYLDLEKFKSWRPEFNDAEFELEESDVDGNSTKVYKCGYAVEKMSKSLFNVVNPDTIVEEYGADTLRLYEMFLGPVEQSKPWNTNGIEGVFRFLTKLWRLIYDEDDKCILTEDKATPEELKILHTCIKKVSSDMENFSFNTSVSAFMILVNDLTKIKCNKKEIIKPLICLMAPFTPHLSEEIWSSLNEKGSVLNYSWPELNESFLIESTYKYPVSFNGKMKFLLDLPLDITKDDVESIIRTHEKGQTLLEGKTIKKLIFVPKKIINFVI